MAMFQFIQNSLKGDFEAVGGSYLTYSYVLMHMYMDICISI